MGQRASRSPTGRCLGLAQRVFSSTLQTDGSSRRMCTVKLAWISSFGSAFSSSAPEGFGFALPFFCFFSAALNDSVKAASIARPQDSLLLQKLERESTLLSLKGYDQEQGAPMSVYRSLPGIAIYKQTSSSHSMYVNLLRS